ncbi:MAG: ABC transporter ATP-binding protein [Deltaproteobacteria bacterium]|nr:ABC transporter ATP-binding protein [Deltaproteobacteria bacterium]
MSAPLLEVKEVGLSFAGVRALDGVSLSVEEGELAAVIGPNGAGKTSLFNCISGFYRPQQGSLSLAGRDLRGMKPHHVARLGVSRMFQNLALFEYLTVLENLLLGRHIHFGSSWWQDLLFLGRTRKEEVAHREKVEEVIDFLDLERFRLSPVGMLPYGVLKRVELGRALCMAPRLLLLDEPAAGLNQEETEDMARYLLDIKEELGTTLVLIEHDLRFVFDLADHITVLDFGRGIAHGKPEEVREDQAVIDAYIGGEVA